MSKEARQKFSGGIAPISTDDIQDKAVTSGKIKLEPNVSQPANALDTIFENTSGRTRMVIVSVAISTPAVTDSVDAIAEIGETSPPGTVAANAFVEDIEASATLWIPLTFIVPEGWFYRIRTALTGTGAISVGEWTEIDF